MRSDHSWFCAFRRRNAQIFYAALLLKGKRKKIFLVLVMAAAMLMQQTGGAILAEEDVSVQEEADDRVAQNSESGEEECISIETEEEPTAAPLPTGIDRAFDETEDPEATEKIPEENIPEEKKEDAIDYAKIPMKDVQLSTFNESQRELFMKYSDTRNEQEGENYHYLYLAGLKDRIRILKY